MSSFPSLKMRFIVSFPFLETIILLPLASELKLSFLSILPVDELFIHNQCITLSFQSPLAYRLYMCLWTYLVIPHILSLLILIGITFYKYDYILSQFVLYVNVFHYNYVTLIFSNSLCVYPTELHLTFYLTNSKSFQQKILINISNAAPGTPNIPTIIELIILKPIWKLNDAPTKFITNIIIAPTTELAINLIIFFSGNAKYFPKIKRIAIHAIKDKITLLSITILSLSLDQTYHFWLILWWTSILYANFSISIPLTFANLIRLSSWACIDFIL